MASRNFRILLLTGVSTLMVPQGAMAQLLTGFDGAAAPAQQENIQTVSQEPAADAPPGLLTAPQPAQDVKADAHTPPPVTDLPVAMQAEPLSNMESTSEPVSLDAETLEHDEKNNLIIASGNVFLEQSGRILRADKITYDLKKDTAVASGHVVLNEENGNIHYAENVKFNDKLKNGFVEGLKVYLADGSRFTALNGKRTDGRITTMKDATYSPCELCKRDPDKPPLWQIRASEVVHDDEKHNITYKNATFEVKGVPIAYAPYFVHADGTIKRKSGFLAPSGGYRSDLGAFVENKYYWAIAPDKDATFGIRAMTKESPLYEAEWRQRWANANLELSGGITDSHREDSIGGVTVEQDKELRGHVLGHGLWDINDKWRSGINIAWASDDQYMRQYDFSDEDVLENEVYAERFSGRDYAVGRLLTFQDVRVRELQEEQPAVLPEVIASFKGDPDGVPVIGGRWALDGSLLGLQREGSDQDMNRMSLTAGWNRRLVSDYGLVTTADLTVRGDIYNTRDRTIAMSNSGIDDSVTATRFFPQMNVQTSYPMAKPLDNAQITIEPIAEITLAPNIDINDDIPNEDSQDAQIDVSNLFDANRFPGLDRVEDQSRVTYGVRTGLYGYDGSSLSAFLGQSHRFQEDDNPFPAGSGLDHQNSDVVGQISAYSGRHYSLNYRFQLQNDTLASQRQEIEASGDWNKFYLSSKYFYASSLEGTDIDESREQASAAFGYYITPEWRVTAGATEDLGESPGLRKAHLGLDYFGQCLSWSLEGKRNYTDDASGESDTEVLFKIGLKNLGGYESTGLRPDPDRD